MSHDRDRRPSSSTSGDLRETDAAFAAGIALISLAELVRIDPTWLALALMRGKLDVAFLRPETQSVGVSFKFLAKEPLIAVLPADHRLTSRKKIRPQDLARETYVSSARISPVLQSAIQDYASKVGITLKPEYEGDGLPSAMSLVVSTGGITLIPLYAQNMLTPNVVA
nr:LysR substrate-binding domain-containing protein [Rhizobium sp. BK251]